MFAVSGCLPRLRPAGVDEDDGAHAALSRGAGDELVPRPRRVIEHRRRGPEQQSPDGYQMILRTSHERRHRSGVLSYAWTATRAGDHPQIVLTRH